MGTIHFVVLMYSLATRGGWLDSPAPPLAVPEGRQVARIVIQRWTQQLGTEEQPKPATITDRRRIESFLKFLRDRNRDWRKPFGTFPGGFEYAVTVESEKELLLVLWVSPRCLGGCNGGQGAQENRLRGLKAEEWRKMTELLGLR
jgi:hypothetical protein